MQELEHSAISSSADIFALKSKLDESAKNETSLHENVKQLKVEVEGLQSQLKEVNSEKSLKESLIEEMKSQVEALQIDTQSKDEKISLLVKEAADLKQNYDVRYSLVFLKTFNAIVCSLRHFWCRRRLYQV